MIPAPEGLRLDSNVLRAQLIDDKGKRFNRSYVWVNAFGAPLRDLEPDDFGWWSASADGGWSAFPWTNLAPRRQSWQRQRWQASVHFQGQGPIGRPTKLTLYRYELLRTELPFELHDVPLP
jgi:hypothetical protein